MEESKVENCEPSAKILKEWRNLPRKMRDDSNKGSRECICCIWVTGERPTERSEGQNNAEPTSQDIKTARKIVNPFERISGKVMSPKFSESKEIQGG